jgi:hypothetical protein
VRLRRPGVKVLAADLVVLAGRQPADRALTDCELARVRITHALRTTMRRVALHHPALSEHLNTTVSTCTYCAYQPDPRRPVEWEDLLMREQQRYCGDREGSIGPTQSGRPMT